MSEDTGHSHKKQESPLRIATMCMSPGGRQAGGAGAGLQEGLVAPPPSLPFDSDPAGLTWALPLLFLGPVLSPR